MLALDQGMILAAIANALADDVMQRLRRRAGRGGDPPPDRPRAFTAAPRPAAAR